MISTAYPFPISKLLTTAKQLLYTSSLLLTTMITDWEKYSLQDETYIKVKGIRGYIWFIIDAVKRSIIGYRISCERDVGACHQPLWGLLP